MFEKEIQFLVELDKLKNVERKTLLFDASRNENSAEHSWNLAMAVMLFAEESNEKICLNKAIKMALIHDIVEVYAGDTFVYDSSVGKEQFEKESSALDKLLAHLNPSAFTEEVYSLWHEFEKEESPEAKYVKALDRLLPMLQNWKTEGHSWKKHQIKSSQVIERNSKIQRGSTKLWELAQSIIEEAKTKNYLKD